MAKLALKPVFDFPNELWHVQQKFQWISSFYPKYNMPQLESS